jgi:endonuclease G, mitochondrial
MKDELLYNGFNIRFLQDEVIDEAVPLPILSAKQKMDLAPVEGNAESILHYCNFSIQLSESRKFPFFAASNIDGSLFKNAERPNRWKKDKRVKKYQWGRELYGAAKSDFDRGHMIKREYVQWGETLELAQNAAQSTFFYSNSVPQHSKLNQKIWKSLENYILHTETRKKSLKVCVLTGPVLSEDDPAFVTKIKGKNVLIPILFWKVVFYPKEDGKLYRVGFMMSQKKLLMEDGIVDALETGTENTLFMQFEDAATYQVNIALIEQLTELEFPKAIDAYNDHRNQRLVLNEIDLDLENVSTEPNLGFLITNLVL